MTSLIYPFPVNVIYTALPFYKAIHYIILLEQRQISIS